MRTGQSFTIFQVGLSIYIPAPADYDRDGRIAAAVFRPEERELAAAPKPLPKLCPLNIAAFILMPQLRRGDRMPTLSIPPTNRFDDDSA